MEDINILLNLNALYKSLTDVNEKRTIKRLIDKRPMPFLIDQKIILPESVLGQGRIFINQIFNIKINELNDFLGLASGDSIMSNRSVAEGNLLGTKVFNGSISAIKITKDSDNSDLYIRDAALRIPLDSTFFQNKIINYHFIYWLFN